MLVYRRKKRGKPVGPWRCQYYDRAGIRHDVTTRCRDKAAAIAVARDFERAASDPASAARQGLTMIAAMNAMLDHGEELVRAGQKSAATVAIHRLRAGHWCSILGDGFALGGITSSDVDRYVTVRRTDREPASNHTLHKEFGVLRMALGLAQHRGLWVGTIDALFPPDFEIGYVARERVFKNRDELAKLLSETGLEFDRGARVAWMIACAGEKGACDRALRTDVRTDENGHRFVRVRGSKNDLRDREVAIVTEFQSELLDFALEHGAGAGDSLFRPWHTGSYIRDLAAACTRVGIEPITPNDCRRTCATWLREHGVPNELVASIMGHVDTTMVERVYGRLDAVAVGRLARIAIAACSAYAADPAVPAGHSGQAGHGNQQESPGKQRAMQNSNLRPLASEVFGQSRNRPVYSFKPSRRVPHASGLHQPMQSHGAS